MLYFRNPIKLSAYLVAGIPSYPLKTAPASLSACCAALESPRLLQASKTARVWRNMPLPFPVPASPAPPASRSANNVLRNAGQEFYRFRKGREY